MPWLEGYPYSLLVGADLWDFLLEGFGAETRLKMGQMPLTAAAPFHREPRTSTADACPRLAAKGMPPWFAPIPAQWVGVYHEWYTNQLCQLSANLADRGRFFGVRPASDRILSLSILWGLYPELPGRLGLWPAGATSQTWTFSPPPVPASQEMSRASKATVRLRLPPVFCYQGRQDCRPWPDPRDAPRIIGTVAGETFETRRGPGQRRA
jgi:hypothetical protein